MAAPERGGASNRASVRDERGDDLRAPAGGYEPVEPPILARLFRKKRTV